MVALLPLFILLAMAPHQPTEADPAIEIVDVRPQRGPQELFASTPADVAIIGGSVYGGKTWSLVVEPLRHVDVPDFNFVAFRREDPEIMRPGGIWDESKKWYPYLGGEPVEHKREWIFGDGAARGKFSGLQYEKDLKDWLGAQICLLLFDQLETFSETQFFTMLGRNRSMCGVEPYTRGSCNPDPDSFLVQFLAWWIDDEGWAMPARSGVIRWFIRPGDELVWSTVTCAPQDYDDYETKKAAAKKELERLHPGAGKFAKSVTFVLARLQDNTIGQDLDPEYEGNVRLMPYVEQQRLLGGDRGGNWKIRPAAGLVFNRAKFGVVKAKTVGARRVRYWDKAGTKVKAKTPAATVAKMAQTAGVLVAWLPNGRVVIEDVITGRWGAHDREVVMKQTAAADGPGVTIWIEQEPGSGGKESAENSVINLGRWTVYAETVRGNKIERANPLAAQVQAGNVDLLEAPWNEAFLKQAHGFPEGLKDMIDAAAGAYNKLRSSPVPGTSTSGDVDDDERF